MTTHTRIRPFAARMLWLIGLTAFLVMTFPWQQGLAQPGTGLADLGIAHFSPATRPPLADIPANGIGHNFQLMDFNPLNEPGTKIARGGNGNDIPIVRDCLYAASRSTAQRTLIVDISNPRRTTVVGGLPHPVPRRSVGNGRFFSIADMTAIESRDLLVRQVWNTSPPFDGNRIEIFDTSGNCFNPRLASTIPLGDNVPHEHFLWQSRNRVLLYVSFSSGQREDRNDPLDDPFPAPPHDIDIRVFDITDKFSPLGLVATWSLQRFGIPTFEPADLLANGGQRQRNITHSMNLTADGKLVYVSQTHAGFFILDSTPLATGAPCEIDPDVAPGPGNPFGVNPNACLKKLHPDPNVRLDYHPPFTQGTTHTAAKVPGRPYVILNDEPGPCPWTWIRVVFVGEDGRAFASPGQTNFAGSGDLFPSILGAFQLPENNIQNCAENNAKFGAGTSFNAHKSLVFENLVFVSWRSGGVRAIDISNPGTPHETGFFFNKPAAETFRGGGSEPPGIVDPELQIRSYPVLRDGLLYFLDGRSGLYVLKYTGERNKELPQEGQFQPNAIQVPE